MKIDAVGVASTNLHKTLDFYSLLGFKFAECKDDEQHVEAIVADGSLRLMIDSASLIKDIIGEDPKPSNISSFAIKCDSPEEVNTVAAKVKEAGFSVIKEPWDAFWGQRYAIVADPDGFKIDLFASLS